MISVLIPVFNRNVGALVTSVHNQLIAAKLPAEVVVMDDASTDEQLKKINAASLSGLSNVKYITLPVNAGRNIIRHKLAAAAIYNTLIFIDADSSLPDTLWLQRYIDAIANDSIIMGGRLYHVETPGASSLHYRYGKLREENMAAQRTKFPWRSFLACNFLISKQQLAALIIDNHLQGYCHEDTFMGLQFKQLNIPIVHIDNPVYHEGIDDDVLFMSKQKEALENLHYLYQTYSDNYAFDSEIKLIRVYNKLAGNAAGKSLLNLLARMEAKVYSNCLQTKKIFWLDLWKLSVYHKLAANRK